jgi:hypothetical protein
MPFQTTVNANPAPAFEGDWASANPHTSMLTPSNGDPAQAAYPSWTVGAGGCIVGRFAFANLTNGQVTSAQPAVAANLQRVGFIGRDQPVVIQGYLGGNASTLYAGQEVDIMDSADVWVRFPNGGTVGQKVFAATADGAAIGTAVIGGTVTNGVETRWYLDSPVIAGELGKISTRG